ncbi:unnamed protein product [Strongylus vulgaris]|uniref:Uncharacterized protein n=1 Tax=Strongylus vulgaris TaxID=40348 RepID=A0A3P7JPD0_STRVU|nr:unnamed protein product [Strongylus vulgaris]
MPMVRVATNLPDKDVPANFEEDFVKERLTDILADSMKKPKARIAIEVMAGQRITHGASRNPVVLIKERLTDILADSMKKPKARIAIEVMAGQRITHGASRNPVVLIKIEAIGAMSPEDNIRHTQKVTEMCQEALKLPQDKV